MSAFHRFMNLPASRRSYSFFSSRSGGGRYFNSAKPSKNAVVVPKNGTTKADSSNELQNEQTATSGNQSVAAQNAVAEVQQSGNASSSSSSPSATSAASPSSTTATSPQRPTSSNPFAEFAQYHHHAPQQLAVSSKDFKMHQFFSLHRPLLLISQPNTLFRPAPPNHSIFEAAPPALMSDHGNLNQPYEFGVDGMGSIDADAEAARQLTRALTMNKAGATIAWEETLKRLGLDMSQDSDRVNLQEQFKKEWDDVLMDSTKRKRRKKMKTHKLKKRRRATRSERLRLK